MGRALICGVSGQDGAYLADLLLKKGYEVYGISRDVAANSFRCLKSLGIEEKVHLHSMSLTDLHNVVSVMSWAEPDEVYNLAGQSSVGLSFEQPVETIQSIVTGTQNILEAIRLSKRTIRFYSAGSSECFGDGYTEPATESTPFSPKSPYALAKSTAFWQVSIYRQAYGIHAVTGILFNHESAMRPSRFVTMKIINAAKRIADGEKTTLVLGDLDIHRDWGYTPEYVEAMWRMLQLDRPADVVVASGHVMSLRDFVRHAFECHGLDWQEFTAQSAELFRPNELRWSCGNPAKAKELLDWKARMFGHDLVQALVADWDRATSS